MNNPPTIMRAYLTIVLCIASIHQTLAQVSVDIEHNSIRTGDVLQKQKVITDDIWNLSHTGTCGKTFSECYVDFKPDTVTCLFNGTRRYYVYSSDSLFYIGSENPQVKESLYLPVASRIYPMSLGDRYSGSFAAHVNYCEKMIFHKYGTYVVHADSIGPLVLPDGDSITKALEIKTEYSFLNEQIDSCSSDGLPTYSQKEISLIISGRSDVFIETERALYAKGYRYPIITDYILHTPLSESILRETYYYPPKEQESLPFDVRNAEAREQIYNTGKNGDAAGEDEIISVYIRQNREAKQMTFDSADYFAEHQEDGTIQCRLLISDSKGILYRSKDFSSDSSTNAEISISYAGLRRGQYVVSLVINNQIYPSIFSIE